MVHEMNKVVNKTRRKLIRLYGKNNIFTYLCFTNGGYFSKISDTRGVFFVIHSLRPIKRTCNHVEIKYQIGTRTTLDSTKLPANVAFIIVFLVHCHHGNHYFALLKNLMFFVFWGLRNYQYHMTFFCFVLEEC